MRQGSLEQVNVAIANLRCLIPLTFDESSQGSKTSLKSSEYFGNFREYEKQNGRSIFVVTTLLKENEMPSEISSMQTPRPLYIFETYSDIPFNVTVKWERGPDHALNLVRWVVNTKIGKHLRDNQTYSRNHDGSEKQETKDGKDTPTIDLS
jgi:hypothetical protein